MYVYIYIYIYVYIYIYIDFLEGSYNGSCPPENVLDVGGPNNYQTRSPLNQGLF